MGKNILLICALVFAGRIFAQSAIDPAPAMVEEGSRTGVSIEERAKDAAYKLNTRLQLSEAQYAKVLEIYKTVYALFPQCAGGNKLDNSINEKVRKQAEEMLKPIFTPEQWKKAQDTGLAGEK